MQFTVNMMFNGTQEIQNAGNFTKIRLFTASLLPSATPVEELLGINLNWSVASPESVGGPVADYFSAVCWVYGRMIHQALGGRPIGLIATSYSGTPVEYWMPPQALQDCNVTSSNIQINNSNLFNSMIYPFTRTVIYGSIWYQGKQ
jgi:sialate O-acetylesterase